MTGPIDASRSIVIENVEPELNCGRYAVKREVGDTLEVTTLSRLQPGSKVNLEVDLVARYVERLLAARS